MSIEGTGTEQARAGLTLRQAREARELSLAEVSAKILVRENYLANIEDMYVNDIPKGYLNAFLRTYANFLNLPADDVIATFAEQCGAVSQKPRQDVKAAPVAPPMSRNLKGALYAVAAAGLMIIGGGAVVLLSPSSTSVATETITEAGVPVNGARQSLLARVDRDELAAQLPLRLTAVKSGWLEVRGADGTIFRSRKMTAGEDYFPRIGAGWTVTTQDGSAFVWNVGDIEIGPMSESSAAVYALSVDDVAQDAQEVASPAFAAFGDSQPTR